MAKYKIRIEALDPTEELRAEYRMGIESEGFCIIADKDEESEVSMHNVSNVDIAQAIANTTDLMCAAEIARGFWRAGRIRAEDRQAVLYLLPAGMDRPRRMTRAVLVAVARADIVAAWMLRVLKWTVPGVLACILVGWIYCRVKHKRG